MIVPFSMREQLFNPQTCVYIPFATSIETGTKLPLVSRVTKGEGNNFEFEELSGSNAVRMPPRSSRLEILERVNYIRESVAENA